MTQILIPKSVKLFTFIIIFYAFSYSTFANNFLIKNLEAKISLSEKGEANINEIFEIDFSNAPFRGIARDIPTNQRPFNFISAVNEKNETYDNKAYQYGNKFTIEMRTPDQRLITENATFNLVYKTKGVINFFTEKIAKEKNIEKHEEFFWNVNGTNWNNTFEKIKAEVVFPFKINEEEIKAKCFTGIYGSNESDCKFEIYNDKVNFYTTRNLNSFENLSIVLAFPENTFKRNLSTHESVFEIQKNGDTIITENSVINGFDINISSITKIIPKKILNENKRYKNFDISGKNNEKILHRKYSVFDEKQIIIYPEEEFVPENFETKIKYKSESFFNIQNDQAVLSLRLEPFKLRLPYETIQAKFIFPDHLNKENTHISCKIIQDFNSLISEGENQDCSFEIKNNEIKIFTNRIIEFNEHLIFSIVIPRENLYEASTFRKIKWFLIDNKFHFISPIVFLLMFSLWLYKGRDKGAKNLTVIPRWETPKSISVAEAGALYNEKLDIKEITATIINLAVKGFIKIKEIETERKKKDYELIIIKKHINLFEDEKEIFNTIFKKNEINEKIKLSELKHKFYHKKYAISITVFKSLIKKGFLIKDPNSTRLNYCLKGCIFMIAGIPLALFYFSLDLMINIIISTIIILAFSRILPGKTYEGTKKLFEIKGVEMYIKTAEIERIKHFEKDEKEKIFLRLLPYAIIFNQTKHWSNKFKDILKTPPSFFEGNFNKNNTFNAVMFQNSLISLLKNSSKTINEIPKASSPNKWTGGGSGGISSGGSFSSGGGFSSGGSSGGGFGGGGGRGL